MSNRLRPATQRAIAAFWQAAGQRQPIRALFERARDMSQDDLFDDEEKPERIIVCQRCGRSQPAYKYLTTTGNMSPRCEDCRKAQGAKARAGRDKAKTLATPPVVTTNGLVTIRLTPAQVERLTALVLREIVAEPGRLAQVLPGLLDLIEGAGR